MISSSPQTTQTRRKRQEREADGLSVCSIHAHATEDSTGHTNETFYNDFIIATNHEHLEGFGVTGKKEGWGLRGVELHQHILVALQNHVIKGFAHQDSDRLLLLRGHLLALQIGLQLA